LYFPFLGIFHHASNFVIGQEHDALCLGNAVYLDAKLVQSLKQSLHRSGTLYARHFKAVLTTVFKTFF